MPEEMDEIPSSPVAEYTQQSPSRGISKKSDLGDDDELDTPAFLRRKQY